MSLIVMKFGGTSVSTAENRAAAMDHVRAELRDGRRVVVVVSAMGRRGAPYATDTLLSLVQGDDLMLKDQLISCGETISACVFADELSRSGVPAKPFTGESARIVTDSVFGGATVTGMDTGPLSVHLESGVVPVVTGFQGRTPDHFTTTLGRGGSDTSAVLIGGYLKADIVDIYTDVPGVAKVDPRLVPEAEFMDSVSQRDMLLLAQWGSGVIHPRAVQAAIDFHLPLLRVRSTFPGGFRGAKYPAELQSESPGTVIGTDATPGLVGIAVLKDPAQAPMEGRAFAQSLPEGSGVVTVLYHGEGSVLSSELKLAECRPALMDGDAIHIGVPLENVAETAGRLYEKLN